MVAKAKKGLIISSVACAALGVALCFTATHIAYANKDDSKPCNNQVKICTETAEYISDNENLQSIISGMNRIYDYGWTANNIEYMCDIYILDYDRYGVYVDFDGDNGYLVLTATDKVAEDGRTIYNICGHAPKGDCEYFRIRPNSRKLYFNDGFLYKDADGCYYPYENDGFSY